MGVDAVVCDWCFEPTYEYHVECVDMQVPGKELRLHVSVCLVCQEKALPLLGDKDSDHVYEFSPDFLAVYRQRLRAHRDDVNNKMDEIAAMLSDDEEEEESSEEEDEEEDEDEVFEDAEAANNAGNAADAAASD
jgi:hypothetical protein